MAAFALVSAAGAAHASGTVTISVQGTFDSQDPSLSSNSSAALLHAPYSMAAVLGTDTGTLLRTEVDASQSPVQTKAWFFNAPSSLSTSLGGWTAAQSTGGVVASITNDYAYDGSAGLVPAGVYDVIDITGWQRGTGPVVDPVACPHPPGGSLLGDSAPGPCSLAGGNNAIDIKLIGASGLVNSLNGVPFGDLDFSQLLYVQTDLRHFVDGALVGGVSQDPPVTYRDGVISGPGIQVYVSTASVPEPATWALMIAGFGLAGAALRRRRADSGGKTTTA